MSDDVPSEKLSLTEVFERVCPVYMVYGMTYEQFWFGDPWMARSFREAYLLKRKSGNDDMWIQGIYFYNALQAVIATAFGKRKEEYVKKPFDFFPKTEAEKKEEEREKKTKLIRILNAWGKSVKEKQKQ